MPDQLKRLVHPHGFAQLQEFLRGVIPDRLLHVGGAGVHENRGLRPTYDPS